MHRNIVTVALFVSASIAGAATPRAQCLEWDSRFFLPGMNDTVRAMAVFDDGSGPALYLGGDFNTGVDFTASGIVRWNGLTWSGLGTGVDGSVHEMQVFDDGSGPALFVGGEFTMADGVPATGIAKWQSGVWSALPTSSHAVTRAMTVFDDGTGPALFTAGEWVFPSQPTLNRIARWNGTSWSLLTGQYNSHVHELLTFDDGTGPALYVCGAFSTIGGIAAARIARWNGSTWSTVGTGFSGGDVASLGVFDDGSGPAIYAGGNFTIAGGNAANRIAKWNGTSWSALASGMQGSGQFTTVDALREFDDGSGSALYAAGVFLTAGGVTSNGIAKWNGSTWSSLSTGMNLGVLELEAFDAGSGVELFAAGDLTGAGDVAATHVARWNGASWAALSPGLGTSGATGEELPLDDSVATLLTYDGGAGVELYIGGTFTAVGGAAANNIARWNGTKAEPLGTGITGAAPVQFAGTFVSVSALAGFDDGSGSALYAAGSFTTAGGVSASRIAKWNGVSWSALGSGLDSLGESLVVFDDGSGPALYAGGRFATAGGITAHGIARWNGSAWTALGTNMHTQAYELGVFDDGTGAALYASGAFGTGGSSVVYRIQKWNGTSWSVIGDKYASALLVFDDGTGAALYAGGAFFSMSGVSARCVARWNGSAWSALASGLDEATGSVHSMTVFDDGAGATLHVAGTFTATGSGASARGIAKWNGTSWSSLASGLGSAARDARALASFDDGADGAADLYVGGLFTSAGPHQSRNIAQWHGCPPGTAYCFGDGIDPVVTAMCPCGNFGDPEHGCGNSVFASGARLIASGKKSPNTVLFTLSNVPNNALATGFRNSTSNPTGAVFGDGVRCQTGALLRFGSHNTGTAGDAPNTWTAGVETVSPGLTRYYLVQYRNSSGFCPPETFNVSHGYAISW